MILYVWLMTISRKLYLISSSKQNFATEIYKHNFCLIFLHPLFFRFMTGLINNWVLASLYWSILKFCICIIYFFIKHDVTYCTCATSPADIPVHIVCMHILIRKSDFASLTSSQTSSHVLPQTAYIKIKKERKWDGSGAFLKPPHSKVPPQCYTMANTSRWSPGIMLLPYI